MPEAYDYIIAGGGCAGMSLAYHFIQDEHFRDKRILVIEKDSHEKQDKTWCYWAKERPTFKSAEKVSWGQFVLSNEVGQLHRSISPYRYFHVNSMDFYQEIQELIENSAKVNYLNASIGSIEEEQDKVIVNTDKGSYESAYLFSSLPEKLRQEDKKYHYLKQHFLGWEIFSEQANFDSESVHLMDFDHSGAANSFFYILPFSSQKALIEFTLFSEDLLSKEVYESQLKAYIEEKLGIKHFEIKYRPDILPRIFLALFEQNPPEKVLKFLDEKTHLLEEAQIFLKLPWPPFFAAIYRECVQRGLYLFARYRKAVGFPRFHSGFSKKLSRSS